MPSDIRKDLAEYMLDAIQKNFLISILITSYTRSPLQPSTNLPFGLGKSTLGLWLSYYLNGRNWDTVFDRLCYTPLQVGQLLEPGSPRKNAILWDAVQATAPSEQGVPKAIRALANYLSEERPELACMIMTASNISTISAPMRKLVIFEVIVVERGVYEVQKINWYKDFKNPLADRPKLEYLENVDNKPFPPLPPDTQKRYDQWRVEQKHFLYPGLLERLDGYVKTKEWEQDQLADGELTLEANVVKSSNKYVLALPYELGQSLHKKRVAFAIRSSG